MKTVIATIEGVAPYSQSRSYEVPKVQGEGFDDYESRTWRNRLHCDKNDLVFIPPMAFKNAISEAAKFLSIPIPGKGKSTYTKNFEAGVMVLKPLNLGLHRDEVEGERLFVPADGRRGSGKRVFKWFPVVKEWGGDLEITVFDETVLQTSIEDPDKSVCQIVVEKCGKYIGIGRFRPRNNGFYGRFDVNQFVIV